MPVKCSIGQRRRKWKVNVVEKRKMTQEMMERFGADDLDVTAAFIQGLIPCGLAALEEKLVKTVDYLVGEKRRHGKENVRWGSQPGSVYLRDQKIPIMVPRVRNKAHNIEIPLELYKKLQRPYLADRQTILKLLNGISTHKYRETSELVPEVFGISPSNLSKRFKLDTTETLKKLQTRSLSAYEFACIFIDGKRFAKDGLLIVLGVTVEGKKMVLDIAQSYSENVRAAAQLFEKLIERGLRFEKGLLFIADGSKGLTSAIRQTFKEYAFIQRCHRHKQENVTSYLTNSQKEICKRELKDAYKRTNYKEAKAALEKLHRELLNVNQTAANSLMEGLEETLTLHRLGLSPELKKSLNTTNVIESVISQVSRYNRKVSRWHNSSQILRWSAAGLLELEPNLRKIRGYRYLGVLRFRMREEIKKRQKEKYGSKEQKQEVLEAMRA